MDYDPGIHYDYRRSFFFAPVEVVMRVRYLIRVATALVLASTISTPAEAQLGKLGSAIKKKAKEAASDAVLGKEETKQAESAPAAKGSTPATAKAPAPPVRVAIDSDVIDRMMKGMAAESAKRQVKVTYDACEKTAGSSQEFMSLMQSFGPQMEKANDDKLSDQQKMEAAQRLAVDMEKKQKAFLEKRCGVEPGEMTVGQYEVFGAAAAGLTRPQYGMLKERIAPFCTAAAKGGSVPANAQLVYTDEEMAALRPRCTALLASIKKLS